MPGKRIQIDDETWSALDLLARDSMKSFQELADEAFRDLLDKHDRPTSLKAALRKSVRRTAANDAGAPGSRPPTAKKASVPRRKSRQTRSRPRA